MYNYNVLSRNEHRFLLAGLKVPKHSDWTARQAAYLSAIKEFLLKLNPDFSSIEVTFVKALNVGRKEDKRLFLSVDCKEVQQYVMLYMNKTIKYINAFLSISFCEILSCISNITMTYFLHEHGPLHLSNSLYSSLVYF